jgi:hypothetical protein
MNTVTNTGTITLPAKDLIAAAGVVAASAGKDKSLPMLTVLQLNTTPNGVELVATDRYRLTTATIKGAQGYEDSILIPAAPLAKWLTGLKSNAATDTVEFIAAGDKVTLIATILGETSSITLTLSDTKFPDYSALGLDPASDRYTGASVNTLGVSPKLLAECAAALNKVCLKGNPVKLHVPNENTKPMLLTLDTDNVSYITALMPMRVI